MCNKQIDMQETITYYQEVFLRDRCLIGNIFKHLSILIRCNNVIYNTYSQ